MHKQVVLSVVGALAVVVTIGACSQPPPPAPPKMTNDDLDRSVTGKINSDATLVPYHLDVDADADKNQVTISGNVPAESLRTRALDAAKTVDPTLVITDKIDVKPGDVERSAYNEDMAREARERAAAASESVGDSLDDAWIHTKVRSKLAGEGELPGGSINVDVKNNVVTLRGSVATVADRTKAASIAKDTEGVKSVVNRLVIKPAK
ncbi:MAG: BON domain-containing protein [Acidobacteriota bacterium]